MSKHGRHLGRGYRIHQDRRARERATRLWKVWFSSSSHDKTWWTEENKKEWIAKQAVDRKRCSCFVCSYYSRRYVGPTLAEIRQHMHEVDEDEEILAGYPSGEGVSFEN